MTHDPYGQNPGDDQERERPNEQPRGQPPTYEQPPQYSQPPTPDYDQSLTPPPGYGQPYPYPQPKQDDKALAALILSVAAWAVCPFVLHIVALVLANQSLEAIRESNGWLTGAGAVSAGTRAVITVRWRPRGNPARELC
jgi:hypothetical protein